MKNSKKAYTLGAFVYIVGTAALFAIFLLMIAMALVGMCIFLAMWRAKATGYDEQKA